MLRLALVLVAVSINAAFGVNNCVKSFYTHRFHFDVCIRHECLVFRVEKPFIFVDPAMSGIEAERPFLCKTPYREQRWPKLRGPQFKILDEMLAMNASDTYCVWAGESTCGFDDLISFVDNVSQKTNHKFIAVGLLFNLRYRVSSHSIASEPLTDDELLIIGPRRETTGTIGVAWQAMWAPFTTRAWIFLFVSVTLTAILRILVSLTYTHPFKWRQVASNVVGDYERNDSMAYQGDGTGAAGTITVLLDKSHSGKRLATLKRLNTYWANASKLGFLIMILYYEVALILFDAQQAVPFADLRPGRFVVISNSTEEYVTRVNVFRGQEGWARRDNIDAVYQSIEDTKSAARFTGGPLRRRRAERGAWSSDQSAVRVQKFNRYQFRQRPERCDVSQVYDLKKKLPRLHGVWYYTSNVARARRAAIDREIMRLRENGRIDKLSDDEGFGTFLPSACEPVGSRITFPLLALPLVFIPGPVFFFVFAHIVVFYLRHAVRCITRKGAPADEGSVSTTESQKGDPDYDYNGGGWDAGKVA